MKLNEDLELAKARWQAWFDGKLTKGPIVAVVAPMEKPRETPRSLQDPGTPEGRITSVDYFVGRVRNAVMATWYGGDAIPSVFVNLGPGSVAAYLGGKYEFNEKTIWFGGFLESDELPYIHDHIAYNPDHPYWQLTKDLTQALLDDAEGAYYTSYTDLGGELDILASLRGSENLLMDMIENPDLVHSCEDRICDAFMKYFQELTKMFVKSGQDGYTCWLPCYSARPWYSLQCDLSVMFSPAMFQEFIVPRLKRKAAAMGNAIYHWDGPEELQHVDHICSVPGVNALEYVAVADRDPPNASVHYLPWYLKAAEAGRGILIRSKHPDLALELASKMPAERLAIIFSAASVTEGQKILDRFGDRSSV